MEEKLDEQGLYSDDERDSKWDVFYEEATVEVEELSDEEVRDKCAAMQAEEAESALADQRFRLADHRAELRADGMGMSPYSSKREELRDEEMEAVRQLSAEDLDGAIAELEHWEEKGRWSSPQYVTNFLVYERAREEMLAAYEDTGEDEEEFDEEKDAAEWKKHYDKAMSEVTELSLQDQLSKAKAMEEERQREHDRFLAELEERFATQDDEDSFDDEEGIVSLFFSSMFGPFDAICIMLAMYSAFKLGLGEAS